MHIKTGTWEASNAVCESDPLCDPAVLVSAPKPEPHIRNRRLSPGSGSCGGGGGGYNTGVDKPLRQASPSTPEGSLNGPDHTHTFASNRDREQRAQHKGRGPRRDGPKPAGRTGERPQRPNQTQKERWVEDSLPLLKPPPAFPVKDSPAKLQPTVSYASKVKAGGGAAGAPEEPPGIGVLLENQWGLSFISEGPTENGPSTVAPSQVEPGSRPAAVAHPIIGAVDTEKTAHAIPTFSLGQCPKEVESSGELLLSCRHLVEAMRYHTQEWNAIYRRQKGDPAKVVWFKNSLEQPA